MSYQPYLGGYQPHSGYVRPPGGGTAITAGVLACFGAVEQVIGGVMFIGIVGLPVGIVLGAGAIMMFNRKAAGRTLVVVGCVLVILEVIVGLVVYGVILHELSGGGTGPIVAGIVGGISLLFAFLTLVFALLNPTGGWLAHRPATVSAPYQHPYSPQPGYGQPWLPHNPVGQYGGQWGTPPAAPVQQSGWPAPQQQPEPTVLASGSSAPSQAGPAPTAFAGGTPAAPQNGPAPTVIAGGTPVPPQGEAAPTVIAGDFQPAQNPGAAPDSDGKAVFSMPPMSPIGADNRPVAPGDHAVWHRPPDNR